MPIYEFEGTHYDLPDGLSNEQAKQKIQAYRSQSKPTPTSANRQSAEELRKPQINTELTRIANHISGDDTESAWTSLGRGFMSGANRVADAWDAAAVGLGADPTETYDDQKSRHAYWSNVFASDANKKQGFGGKMVEAVSQVPFLANPALMAGSAVGAGTGEAQDVIDKGGDVSTARTALGVSTAINTASNLIPMLGKTPVGKIAFGAVSNPAAALVDQEAQRAVRNNAGVEVNPRMSAEDLIAQSLLGAGFGAVHSGQIDINKPQQQTTTTTPTKYTSAAQRDSTRADMSFDELRNDVSANGDVPKDMLIGVGTGSLKQIARIKDNPYLKWASSKMEQAKNEVSQFASKYVSGKEFTHSNKPVLDLSRAKKVMNTDAIIPQLERFDTPEKMADLATYMLDKQDGKPSTVPVTQHMVDFEATFRKFTDDSRNMINKLRADLGDTPIDYKQDYFPLLRHEQRVAVVRDKVNPDQSTSYDIVPGREKEILDEVRAKHPDAEVEVVSRMNSDLGFSAASEYFNRLGADPKFGYARHKEFSQNKRGTFDISNKNIVGEYMGRSVESYVNATLHYMEALILEKKIQGLREDKAFQQEHPKTASLMEKYIQQAQHKLTPNSVGRAATEIARTVSSLVSGGKNPFLIKTANETIAKAFNYKIAFNVPKQFLGSLFQFVTTGMPHLAAVANDAGLSSIKAIEAFPQAMHDFYNQSPRYKEIVEAAFQSGIIDQTRRLEVSDVDVSNKKVGKFIDKWANRAAEFGEFPQQQARIIYMVAADNLLKGAIPDPKARLQAVFDSVSVAMVDARTHERGTALSGMGDFRSVARSTTTYAANITHTMAELTKRALVDKQFAPIALHMLGTTMIAGLAGNVAVSVADTVKNMYDAIMRKLDKTYEPYASIKDQIQSNQELSTWIRFGGLDSISKYNVSEGLSTDVGVPVVLPYTWSAGVISDIVNGRFQNAAERVLPSAVSNTVKQVTQEKENYTSPYTGRLTSQDFRDTMLGFKSVKNAVAGATDRVALAEDKRFRVERNALIAQGIKLVNTGKADGKLSPMIKDFAVKHKLKADQINEIVSSIASGVVDSKKTPYQNDATSDYLYRNERAASRATK